MLIGLLDHPDLPRTDVGSVEVVMSGGAVVPPELVRRVEDAFGAGFTIVYGQTELSPVITQTDPVEDAPADRLRTCGRPLWNVEIKIVDPGGETVGVGEQGEVCARGDQQMLEYFEMPDRTRETVDADGWLHTGDLGTMDARGYLCITGRCKDMIIRGGENMFPAEIEQAVFAHPGVGDVVVVGVPDPYWGERIAAVVRPADPEQVPTSGELRALCREALAPAKTPADWYVADAFPLTGSGKPQKFRIRELIAAGAYPPLAE
jgi:acyl-CoA synthetase (AMP-forming)/AMP-acid ligase II